MVMMFRRKIYCLKDGRNERESRVVECPLAVQSWISHFTQLNSRPFFAMFAANAVRRAATAAVRKESSRRNVSAYTDIVAAPPSNKVTVTEQVIQGIVLSAGVLAYPVYAMFEVAEHKRAEYAEMEVPEQWQEWRAKQQK